MPCWSIFGHFWCLVVTMVTFGTKESKKNPPKNYKKSKKKSKNPKKVFKKSKKIEKINFKKFYEKYFQKNPKK